MRPIKHEAVQNDLRLLEMALYETTKGQTKNTTQELILSKVLEYKAIIKRGTYTIDQLEDKIFSRYGIVDERILKMPNTISNSDPFMNMLSGILRKSQGVDCDPNLDSRLDPHPKIDSINPSNGINSNESNIEDILKELDDKFDEDKINEDFPESSNNPYEHPSSGEDLPF